MPLKAIIFDLDGTVLDTEILWQQAARDLLSTRGIVPSEAFMHSILGVTIGQLCAMIKKAHNLPDSIEELSQETHKRFLELFKKEAKYSNGFFDFFNATKKLHLLSAVATNTATSIVQQMKLTPPLETFFGEHMYTPETVAKRGKPLPDLYLHAAHKLQVQPTECIVIEDSLTGVMAAKSAGMFCIRLNTLNSPEILAGEDLVVDSFAAIPLEKLSAIWQ